MVLALALSSAVTASAAAVPIVGSNGNDTITGTPFADTISGGRGNDDIDGGGGADDIRGGPGTDAALHGGRTGSVAISLDNVANDGEAGEGDNIHSDVEQVFGGDGGDQLTGNDRGNLLDGAGGNDALFGGRGEDRLYGGPGDDVVTSFDGQHDVADCGPGRDTVTADGTDVLIGCERRVPPKRVRSRVTYSFTYRGVLTRVDRLTVLAIPNGGAVEVRCRGAGCPFAANRLRLRPGQRKLPLANLFRGRQLRAGATIDVRITKPDSIGKVVRFVMRANAGPRIATLCLPPDSKTPGKRC